MKTKTMIANLWFAGLLLALCSCQYMPDIFKDVDDMVTDQALRVELDKACIKFNKNITVNVQVTDNGTKPSVLK